MMEQVMIYTTQSMSEETYRDLCEKLCRKYGKEFSFQHQIKADMIGGFIAELPGEVIDCSILSQLKRMEAHINAGIQG